MPEGPEIRRVADRLGRVLIERPLERVWFAFESLAEYAPTLCNARVRAVDSWGKALLIRFDNGQVLYSHNQLYGVWRISRKARMPSTKRILRVELVTDTHAARLYSASDISLWHEDTLGDHPFLSRLGPDLLTHQVSSNWLDARLKSSRFKKRNLGGLLLDQSLVAGIGNYLRSEILFYAGLLPRRRPADLSDAELARLATCMLECTQGAYREAGVTNRPEWRAPLIEAGHSRALWRHAVFNREGRRCFHCDSLIEKRTIASRRLYLCPICQQ
ncbi:endonuclease VIII [Larsenimonas salina]|uniref:endonuclease VIII n=1 Tax=Larsenimonas salina TaxID=1295565 RepID=UPI002072E71C|nr:endonuclease VIII [Larsenimonas salina]MCM5703490.1 endonuclease VIII [Larsenimonas salina]